MPLASVLILVNAIKAMKLSPLLLVDRFVQRVVRMEFAGHPKSAHVYQATK